MAVPMIRLADCGAVFAPGDMAWPFPEMLAVCMEASGPLWVADPVKLGAVWPARTRLYRKTNESQLGPEVDEMENVFRGAEYERLSDLEMYEWRLPEIRWREPIRVEVADGPRHDVLGPAPQGYFCPVSVLPARGRAWLTWRHGLCPRGMLFAHIEREHCTQSRGEG